VGFHQRPKCLDFEFTFNWWEFTRRVPLKLRITNEDGLTMNDSEPELFWEVSQLKSAGSSRMTAT
jgi:hypothetical protein